MTYDDKPNGDPPPERPRAEPEIIPPDRDGRQSDWRNAPWQNNWQTKWQNDAFSGARGTQRVYVTRMGPFGIALLMLAIAAILAIIVVVALGAVLIWIPVVVAIVAGASLFRRFRGFGPR